MPPLVRKVSVAKRKDPLNDLTTLAKIARHASRSAQEKALSQGVSFTYARNGRIMKRNPDGSEQFIRAIDNMDDFPTIEDDLRQGLG